MACRTYPLGSLQDYRYVVVFSRYQDKILLSRHRERTTWETQGGHIEQGETPVEAAKRELFEESGAVSYTIRSLCDYRSWNEETRLGANGVVFEAEIEQLGPIPESEMAQTQLFDVLPDNLTYPEIISVLYAFWEKARAAQET